MVGAGNLKCLNSNSSLSALKLLLISNQLEFSRDVNNLRIPWQMISFEEKLETVNSPDCHLKELILQNSRVRCL